MRMQEYGTMNNKTIVYGHFILLEKTAAYLYNKQKKIHGCLKIPDLFLVLSIFLS